MLKKYLIMISLMTAFNLMGQNIYQKREISFDTEGKTTTKGEKFTIEQLEKERAETFCNNIKNNLNNSYFYRLTDIFIDFCN